MKRIEARKINDLMFRLTLMVVMICVSFSSNGQNDPAAGKWLDEASATMSGYETIAMDFDYVLDNKAEDVSQALSGSLLLKGEKYVVNLFGSTQIFDG